MFMVSRPSRWSGLALLALANVLARANRCSANGAEGAQASALEGAYASSSTSSWVVASEIFMKKV